MNNKKITTWEAACIITGYGIGGGVLAMPYLAEKNGIVMAMVILFAAFAASLLLHLMIADITLKCDPGAQVVTVFSRFMFKGKWKKPLTYLFFTLMAVVLFANLAAYVAAAAEVLDGILGIGVFTCKLIFYVLAASVVVFGLKAVAVSEKLMVAIIFGLILVLAVPSLTGPHNPLSAAPGTLHDTVKYFGMAMLAFGAFFSVPQAVEGLGGDTKEIRKAIFLGLGNNLVIMIIVIFCALLASEEVTEVGMVGWSAGIGLWAQLIGGVFTLLAMLTTYWSVSLALVDILGEQTHIDGKLCWLIATLPSTLLALFSRGGFLDFLELAGGAIAIIIAMLFVPCYRMALKEVPGGMIKLLTSGWIQLIVVVAYVLMGVGNVI